MPMAKAAIIKKRGRELDNQIAAVSHFTEVAFMLVGAPKC